MAFALFGFQWMMASGCRLTSLLARSLWATLEWCDLEGHPSLLDVVPSVGRKL